MTDLIEVGKDHFASNRFYEAENVFREAEKKGNRRGTLWLGTLYEWKGEYEKAYDHCLRGPDSDHRAALLCRITKHHGDWREAERAALGQLDSKHGNEVRFELARLYDAHRVYDKAWRHITVANSREKASQPKFQHILSGKWEAGKPSQSQESPIFVLGLPRTGTTMVERMLATHPDTTPVGEFERTGNMLKAIPQFWDNMGDLDHAAKVWHTGLERRVLDKMPFNFTRVAFIRGMFPQAKIVHMTRNWRDVLVSLFFRNFELKTDDYAWAYSLDTIKHMIRAHNAVMTMWSGPVLNIPYEGMVQDPGFWVPVMQEFCELSPSDGWRNFHRDRNLHAYSYEEVRKPLYDTSIDRWRNYYELDKEAFLCL